MFDTDDEDAGGGGAFPEPWDPDYDEAIGTADAYAPGADEVLAWAARRNAGPGLASDLVQIDASRLTADEIVTFAQQAQRLASFAAGLQAMAWAAASAQLATHWDAVEAGGAKRSGAMFVPPELAARNELAPALRLAPQTTDLALEHAGELCGPWRPLLDAMLAGDLTEAHAKAIGRSLRLLPAFGDLALADQYASQCADVLDVVIPYAITHTPGDSRRRTEELVLAADPVGARERRRRSVEKDHGVFLEPTDPGSCQITAVMPLAHGAAVMSAIDTLARDERFETSAGCITMGQRRVAAFVALTLGGPGTVGQVTGPVSETKINAQISVVVPLASLLTADEDSAQGGQINGTSVGADVLRDFLAECGASSTVRRLLVDADGTIVDIGRSHYSPTALQRILTRLRDGHCRFPGCRAPAQRCEVDHATSWGAGGLTDLANLGLLCKRHHQAKTHGGWRITRSFRDGRCRWMSPLGRVYDHEPPGLLPPAPAGVGSLAPPGDDMPPF